MFFWIWMFCDVAAAELAAAQGRKRGKKASETAKQGATDEKLTASGA
jgi:hypothetical protein